MIVEQLKSIVSEVEVRCPELKTRAEYEPINRKFLDLRGNSQG